MSYSIPQPFHNIITQPSNSLMNRRYNSSLVSQKQEISTSGCCLNNYFPHEQNNSVNTPSRIRVYSQPKANKQKKIDLVSSKRSRSKDINNTNGNFSKSQFNRSPAKGKQMHVGSTLSSQKNSKLSFITDLRILRPSQQYKNQTLSTKNTYPNLPEITPVQTLQTYTPNSIISEISIVSQQFISQGSATLNVLNLLSNAQSKYSTTLQGNSKSIGTPKSSQFKRQKPSIPGERAMDRKRYDQRTDGIRKKLVL